MNLGPSGSEEWVSVWKRGFLHVGRVLSLDLRGVYTQVYTYI